MSRAADYPHVFQPSYGARRSDLHSPPSAAVVQKFLCYISWNGMAEYRVSLSAAAALPLWKPNPIPSVSKIDFDT